MIIYILSKNIFYYIHYINKLLLFKILFIRLYFLMIYTKFIKNLQKLNIIINKYINLI